MLFLHGIGHFHPENTIDNVFLESLDIGTSAQWILERTGIQRRSTLLPLSYIRETRNKDPRALLEVQCYENAETGLFAARMAMERANVSASDIGLVISGGSAPCMGSPAEACLIAEQLGICAPCLDVNSACSTFAVQIRMLSLMAADQLPDFVLVVNPENLTRTVNYNDKSTAVLMGDCTTASILSKRFPSSAVFTSSLHQSDPANWRKVFIPSAGYLSQDGPSVQSFAIKRMAATYDSLRSTVGTSPIFIGHQANLMMLRTVCARAGVSPDRHLYNVDVRGNCGTAGAPSVLSENWGRFSSGEEIVLAQVGAGLTWAGLRLGFT